jgi:anti-anti-sigma factor
MVRYEVTERQNALVVVTLNGQLVGDLASEEVAGSLERHYVDDGVQEIRVDLSGVDEITLEGVGLLLALWTESRRRGKRLIVQNTRGQVRDKLEVTGTLPVLSAD